MKPFTKRLALVVGLGLIALCCWMAPVYITTTQNWWDSSNGFVRLIVSNQTQQAVMTVDTNTLRVGFNTNNIARSFVVKGQTPPTNATGNGTSAATTGIVQLVGGNGGESALPTTASGGAGGPAQLVGGAGGNAESATTNATGGAGGNISLTSGAGGVGSSSVATNAATGGAGGNVTITGANGGIPSAAATNTVSGNGGAFTMTGGSSTTPSAGWAQKTGNGGGFTITAGNSGNSVRTNSGNGGGLLFNAGTSGNVVTAPGNPGIPGDITFTAGNGGTGDTNANGGRIHLIGGSGAVAGEVVIGRPVSGTSRGGLMVGPLVASSATLTNLLSATATLDFPSVVAGAVADLAITVASAADGDVVSLAVPIASVTNCVWMAWASNGVVYVRAANSQPVTAQDPNSGVFRVKVEKFR